METLIFVLLPFVAGAIIGYIVGANENHQSMTVRGENNIVIQNGEESDIQD